MVKLDMSNNSMFGWSDKSGMRALASALKTNTSLKELNLAKNDMKAADAKIFADGLSANGAMTSLDISANDLRAEGAKHIATAIAECK